MDVKRRTASAVHKYISLLLTKSGKNDLDLSEDEWKSVTITKLNRSKINAIYPLSYHVWEAKLVLD